MSLGPRCFVVVPARDEALRAKLAAAFTDDPSVFVLRDRRSGERAITAVGVFAVGGGALDPVLRRTVEMKLRQLGVSP